MNIHSARKKSADRLLVEFQDMKSITSLAVVLFVLIVSGQAIAQKFPYEVYDPRTLAEFMARNSAAVPGLDKQKQLMIDAKPFYSAVRVKFVGTARPLSAEKKTLIKMWQESLGYDPKVLELLENEYLVRECDKEYWVVVQKQVAAYFPKELKTGDNITLYLMFVGGQKLADKWDFLFIVNEFRKYDD